LATLINIDEKVIGEGKPSYIIAELSANHGGSFAEAVKLITIAKEIGANAVKIQTYTPNTLTLNSDKKEFLISGGTPWDGRTLFELYGEAYMPWEWQPKLKQIADELKITLFSSAFDKTAVDFLEKIGVPAYKVASFEIIDIPLIEYIAKTGKPLILSTGMATLAEIEEAVAAAKKAGASQIALLKCTSAYPALAEEMNLKTIADLAERFKLPVGLSDHSLEVAVPITAVALGAHIIEKHLTITRSVPGPDSAFSLEPDEFKAMVLAVRISEKAMGKVCYEVTQNETASRSFRRSLFIVEDIKRGELFTAENVRSIRPGCGLHPRNLNGILGKCAACDIEHGTPLSWGLISNF
jgi:pseudaminic acid synthase